MDWLVLFGESVVLLIAFLGWLVGYAWNRAIHPRSPDAIRLPLAIGIWFGGGRRKRLYDARGVWLQLFWYSVTPVLQLAVVGVVPLRVAVNWAGASAVTILIMVVLHEWRKGSLG